jgi:hypothetical protein
MSARFTRASITPFDEAGRQTQDAARIAFDFNPETLTLKTSAGVARDKARQGRQQVQHAGATSATLTFEAVFDATRPRDGDGGRPATNEEELDVRLRTRPLALLVQAPEGEAGASGGDAQPAPRRVQFRWGSIVFNGLVTSYQETFDFFSPGGVPLRSKVQLTLTEQEFRYEIDSAERARARTPGGAGFGAGAGGGTGPGGGIGASAGFSASFSAGFSAYFSAGVSLDAELGVSADIGLSAGAGVSLSAAAAVDLFGGAALGTGGASVGRGGLGATSAAGGGKAAQAQALAPSPWAPEGPAPGSQAAGLAAVVVAQRASGAALAAPNLPGAITVLPVRGSPPSLLPRAPAGGGAAPLRAALPPASATGDRAPRWAAAGVPFHAGAVAPHPKRAGCACPCCGGG